MSYVNINNRYMTDNKLGDLGFSFSPHDFRQGEWTDFKAIYLEKLARHSVAISSNTMFKLMSQFLPVGILLNPVNSAKWWIKNHFIKAIEWDRTVMPAVKKRADEIKAELLAREEEEKRLEQEELEKEYKVDAGKTGAGTYGTPAGLLPPQQQTYGQMMPTGAPKKGIDTTMLLLIAAGVIVVGGAFVMMTRKKK